MVTRFIRSLRTSSPLALAVAGVLLLASCEGPGAPKTTPTPTPTAPTLKPPSISSVSGIVEVAILPNVLAGATISSAAGTAQLNSTGSYAGLNIFNHEGRGQVVFLESANGNLMGASYVRNPDDSTADVTGDSLALGLIMMNYWIMALPHELRQRAAVEARRHSAFGTLVADIERSLATSPERALDYESVPHIYQKAVQIGVEIMGGSIPAAAAIDARAVDAFAVAANIETDRPVRMLGGGERDVHILNDDERDSKVALANGTQVFYAVEVSPTSPDAPRCLIKPRSGFLEWRWPPWSPGEADSLEWVIDDGTYEATFYKGFSEEGWTDINTPPGQATYANVIKAVRNALKVAGLAIVPLQPLAGIARTAASDAVITGLICHRTTDLLLGVMEFARALQEPEWTEAFDKALKALANSIGAIARWLFPDSDFDWSQAERHLTKASNIIKGLATAWNAASVINEAVPFTVDIIAKPGKVELCFRFDDGQMYARCSNVPPTADFEVDNANPLIGEEVTFDASTSTDDGDVRELDYRWDDDGDGVWDTRWSRSRTHRATYSVRGVKSVVLEVRDPDELIGRMVRTINVRSAAEFKIVLTWGADPRDLDSNLYTPDGHRIYYGSKGSLSETPYAWLDLDDTNSYGPETVWIGRFSSGTYTYKVHRYAGRGTIATSGAHVQVIAGGRSLMSFDAPSGAGDGWEVFTIDGDDPQTILPVNAIVRGPAVLEQKR